VLTSAFNLARRMGCDPIVFVGADLAFTDMRPYCRGTIYDATWQEWMDKGCTWEALMEAFFCRQVEVWRDDLHGAPTRTAPHLVSFRDWLIEQTASPASGTFINATGAGILRGGRMQQATLPDALAHHPAPGDLQRIVQTHHAAFTSRSHDPERVQRLQSIARRPQADLPIDRWVQFAVSTVTPEQIVAAVCDGRPVGGGSGRDRGRSTATAAATRVSPRA
jgi:hypothetical protein